MLVPSVQDFLIGNSLWNGAKDMIQKADIEELSNEEDIIQAEQGSTLIVIPYLDFSDYDLSVLANFINTGGHVILMDDFGFGNDLLISLGLDYRFGNEYLLDELFCYKDPRIVKITDFSFETDGAINTLLLNNAVILENIPDDSVLAWSSETSFLDTNENGTIDDGEASGPFPVAASVNYGEGVLTLVSDPSFIINTMIANGDNSEFITRLLKITDSEEVYFDSAHLEKQPLETTKTAFYRTREILSSPYILVLIITGVFIWASFWMSGTGEIIEKRRQNN